MRAAAFEGPGKMVVRNVPEPQCGDWGVRIRVRACAVCGTDVRIYKHGQKNVKPPQTIGHEIAGIVEEIGPAALEAGCSPPAGARVVVVTAVGCGRCGNCRRGFHNVCSKFTAIGYDYPGGFAEKMLVPGQAVRQGSLLPAPPGLSFAHASVVEPHTDTAGCRWRLPEEGWREGRWNEVSSAQRSGWRSSALPRISTAWWAVAMG